MFNKRPLPLTDFLASVQTFDIILMHGLFPSSFATETIQGSNWSHSAIVVLAGDLNIAGLDPATPLLWESNVDSAVVDILSGAPKQGPQLTLLYDRIVYNYSVKYDSDVATRKIHLPQPITTVQLGILNDVMQAVHSATFPGTPTDGKEEMLNFMTGRFMNEPVTDNTFFCSQLVAHTFKALGLLTQYYVDNSYAPVDFSEALDVSLLSGWLGREMWLDTNTIPAWPQDKK